MGYWCSQSAWRVRGVGGSCPVVWGIVLDTDPLSLQPCSPEPSQAQSRGRRCGTRRLPGSRPSLTIGSQVHFCLCHLPSHLKGSHDGFISYLNSFQLSLIILQISKSSQAKADRERNMPSATHRAWGSLPHL